MKKYLIMLILFGWIGVVWGQKLFVDTPTQTITYDFQKGKYVKPLKRVKVHTPVVFEVRGINPFAYKVVLTPKDSILASSSFDKELLQTLVKWDIKDSEAKLTSAQSELGKSISTQAATLGKTDFKDSVSINGTKKTAEQNKYSFSLISRAQDLEGMIREEEIMIDSLVKKIERDTAFFKLDGLIKNRQIDIVALEEVKSQLKPNETEVLSEVSEKQKQILNLLDHLEKDLKQVNQYKADKKDITAQIDDQMKSYYAVADAFFAQYHDFMKDSRYVFSMLRNAKAINAVAEDPSLDYAAFKDKYEDRLNSYSNDIQSSIVFIDSYKKSYSELVNAYYKLIYSPFLESIMEPSGIAKTQAYPQFLKTKADQLIDWLTKYPVEGILKEAVWVVSTLSDSSKYIAISAPIQPENDLFEFHVHITKRHNGISSAHFRERSFQYRQHTFGGTRVDFSLGLAASRYWNVDSYELDEKSAIKKIDNKNITVPSLVGMVTMSQRKTKYAAYGASVGMGISTDNGRIQLSNFYLGPTILFGKKDRIFLSIGASLRNVRALKANVNVGSAVPTTNDLSSYLKDLYKIGGFASITYSLTKDAKSMIKNIW